MNPFAELGSFEAMRRAALAGQADFDRFLRVYSAVQQQGKSSLKAVRLSPRIHRMVRLAIASARAVLLVGPPGTGKTEILRQVIREFNEDPTRYGFARMDISALWVTPEEEWTFDSIVLGETVVSGEIQSTEGNLLEAIRSDQWLVLDEANRADMDRVLGGVLTWLTDQPVKIGSWRQPNEPAIPTFLGWAAGPESEVVTDGVPL
ncbi:AAA family ATPase, partial [Mycobacterium avium]